MSEKVEIGKTLIKLKENNYDLTKLTSTERDYLQKISPEFIKAISNIGEVGSKAQEKVYDLINKAIDIFAEQLKDPNLNKDERKDLNDRIEHMVQLGYKKDSEFKKWIFALLSGGVGVAVPLVASPKLRKAALKLLTKGK